MVGLANASALALKDGSRSGPDEDVLCLAIDEEQGLSCRRGGSPAKWRRATILRTLQGMSDGRSMKLSQEFDVALRDLSSARAAYEDEPRDPQRIAALGAARTLLDEARSAMDVERRRLGFGSPWRVVPADVERIQPPPLWSIDNGPSA